MFIIDEPTAGFIQELSQSLTQQEAGKIFTKLLKIVYQSIYVHGNT